MKPEKAAKIILEHIALPEEQYRLGNTKVLKQNKNRIKKKCLFYILRIWLMYKKNKNNLTINTPPSHHIINWNVLLTLFTKMFIVLTKILFIIRSSFAAPALLIQ